VGKGRGQRSGRSGRRGRMCLLVPRTPALYTKISLGLQSSIPKRRKETGQLAELTHVVCELSLELEASSAVLCYAIAIAACGGRA
jgi:hypothetical protein